MPSIVSVAQADSQGLQLVAAHFMLEAREKLPSFKRTQRDILYFPDSKNKVSYSEKG